MPLYEHIFMARQDVSGQQVEALTEQFKGIIEQNGGKVAKVEPWGIKSLTFRIRKNRKAHFTLMNIDAPIVIILMMRKTTMFLFKVVDHTRRIFTPRYSPRAGALMPFER